VIILPLVVQRVKSLRIVSKICEVSNQVDVIYRGADKSLARPGRKQATAKKKFDVRMSYL